MAGGNFGAAYLSSEKKKTARNKVEGVDRSGRRIAHVIMAFQSVATAEYMLGPELGAIIVSQYEGGTDENGW